MRVLFCINEAAPLYKLGGLGDVGGELPKALASLQCDVRLALPFHPEIQPSHLSQLTTFTVTYNHQLLTVTVYLTLLPNSQIPVYLFAEPQYINQVSYALDTNIAKAVVFSLAVAAFCHHFDLWQPHCLHLHDWHTALIPLFSRHLYHDEIPSLITIHNHRYTGSTSAAILAKLDLPSDICQVLSWDQADGELNLLMEGVVHADEVSTVSPTYHDELLEEKSPLSTILSAKKAVFTGILNGLDYDSWNPATDPLLFQRFQVDQVSQGKLANKQAIQTQLNLPQNSTPLIVYIGRVDAQQKGIPLILSAITQGKLPLPDTQFVFLGTGDLDFERQLHQAVAGKSQVKIITRYDEPLAHQLYAAADLILIPSDYEPCGLIQLIAMRYGTLPVAHATGGLKDTIADGKNGYLYQPNTVPQMIATLEKALSNLKQPNINTMVSEAMKPNFNWRQTSQTYFSLYNHLVTG